MIGSRPAIVWLVAARRRRRGLDLREGKISSSPHLTPTDARELLFLGLVDLEPLPAAEMETTPSVPWFAAI